MKVLCSIVNPEIGSYSIEISSMNLPEDVKSLLNPGTEVCDIILLREKGISYTPVKILDRIAENIANFLLSNPNAMLFFLCDDIEPIPHTKKQILPQEYRNKLFVAMFQMYTRHNNISGIKDYPICINDIYGNPVFMHIFAREENERDVMIIYKDLIDNYTK